MGEHGGAPNWYCELGGDNKLKVSAINISETFRYSILKDLTASVTAGYNTSTAIRDKQSKAIDWYNYAGDRVVRSNPTEDKSSYSKSNSRTDFTHCPDTSTGRISLPMFTM